MRSPELARNVLAGLKDGEISRELAVDLLKQINKRVDIAIIGIGATHPCGDDYQEIWQTWASGESYIKRCSLDRLNDVAPLFPGGRITDPWQASKGGFLPRIDLFDHEVFGYDQQEASVLFPHARIVLSTAYRALEDAGLVGEALDDNRTGCFVGYNYSKDQLKSYLNLVYQNTFAADPFNQELGSWSSGMATRVAMAFNLRGPSYLIDSSCPSSVVSVINACQAITTGMCTTALAGGLYLDMTPIKFYNRAGFSMAERDDTVTKLLDREVRGSYPGEYCGFVVLKQLDQAIADGDRIHAVIRGTALGGNGSEAGFSNSSPKGIARAVADVINNSGINVDDVGLFIGEGYAVSMEEALEIAGQAAGFRQFTNRNQFCAMTGLAPTLGYLNSAVGVSNLIAAVLALKHAQIPGLPHFDSPTEAVDLVDSPFYVPMSTLDWQPASERPPVAISYAYGYGGLNALVAVEQAPAAKAEPSQNAEEVLYCLSAASEAAFANGLAADLEFLAAADEADFRAICYTSCARRVQHGRIRLAAVAASRDELVAALQEYQQLGRSTDRVWVNRFERAVQPKRRRAITDRSVADCASGFVRGDSQQLGELFDPADRRFVAMPAYQFDPVRCWVEPVQVSGVQRLAAMFSKPAGFAERIDK